MDREFPPLIGSGMKLYTHLCTYMVDILYYPILLGLIFYCLLYKLFIVNNLYKINETILSFYYRLKQPFYDKIVSGII
jgi:hypothetical protein